MYTIRHLTLYALSGAVLFGATLSAQTGDGPEQKKVLGQIEAVKAEQNKLVDDLLGSIEINGKPLPIEAIKRETVFLAGSNLIELKILEFIVEEWRERLVKEEGKKPEAFSIDDAAIEKELKESLQAFAIKYPGLDFWDAVRAQTGIVRSRYIHQRRVTMMFDKVFMPGPPDQWPAITAEAVKAGAQQSNGTEFWNGLVKSGRDEKGNPRAMPPFWLDMIRKMLVGQLKKWSDIKFPADGLPAGVVLDVNGRKWPTEDAFSQVKEGLFVQDMETAISELVVREVLKQELVAKGQYLSDDEFVKQFNEYREQFDNTLFTTEMIARAFKGYPTLEAFRTRWRLMRSYENMIAKSVNDDVLQEHADKHKRFFADGSVNVDVISFMGKNPRTGAWEPGGMEKARERAEKAMAEIKGGKTFDQTLEARGEYYEMDKERGRLGSKSFNELRRSLRETEYSDLLQGFSLGYFLYYEAEVGQVLGPLKGTDSWYVVRVNSRAPAKQEVSVKDERTRELVKQDFLTYRFLEWSKDTLERAQVK